MVVTTTTVVEGTEGAGTVGAGMVGAGMMGAGMVGASMIRKVSMAVNMAVIMAVTRKPMKKKRVQARPKWHRKGVVSCLPGAGLRRGR
jgi:hypothetical protein